MSELSDIYKRPVELLQNLIRFESVNPPGNERACIEYIREILDDTGIESVIFAKDDQRPNLAARISGKGEAPPLLLYGHVDVVPVEGQDWQHDPFGGELIDGFVWGRGTLDMKGGVAMMLSAFLRAKAENVDLPGDVIFLALSDEEAGGNLGARFMVEDHPEIFDGVKYALGEFGGFNLEVAGKTFFPIQISEKQTCHMKATLHGPGGHGSMIHSGGTMAKLAAMLDKLDKNLLPIHITEEARETFAAFASNLSFPANLFIRALTNPRWADMVLKTLGSKSALFAPLVRNTVNATMVRGGSKFNVIPSEVVVELDVRLLPGFTSDDAIAELYDLLGDDVELEVINFDKGPETMNLGLFETLSDILCETTDNAKAVPLLLTAVTDARFFSRIGIQTYGFTPLILPQDMNFTTAVHAADERVPAAAIEFGSEAIFKALQRFHV